MRARLAAALAGMAILVASAARGEVCDDPLVQGWEPWPPYQFETPDGPRGIDIEIVEAILAEMGCELRHRKLPWKRALAMVERGEIDLLPQANYTEERAAYARYSDPYIPYRTTLMVPAGAPTAIASLDHFLNEDRTVGIVNGYAYSPEVDRLLNSPAHKRQVVLAYSIAEHVRPLAAGRIDGVIANRFAFFHEAREIGLADKVAASTLTLTDTPTYVIFSKASTTPATVEAFNAAMARIRENGTFDRIISKYLSPAQAKAGEGSRRGGDPSGARQQSAVPQS